MKGLYTWQFFVTFLVWLSDLLESLSDLQLGNQFRSRIESPGVIYMQADGQNSWSRIKHVCSNNGAVV